MKLSENSKEMFIRDIPFYENNECFCLGNTLEDAGNITRKIIEKKAREERCCVGMDTDGIKQTVESDSN